MSTYLTQGIVLKSEDYRDYDRKYTIYTSESGKIQAIAKSANKILSKLAPHLELFFVVNLMIAPGEVHDRIAGVQIAKNYSAVKEDVHKIIIASYFLEIVDLLLKFEYPDEVVFKIIDDFLLELSISDYRQNNFKVLNKQVFHLLKHLGYQPNIGVQSQKELFLDFHRLIVEVTERQVNSFGLLAKII